MKTPKEVLIDWAAAYNARDPYALIELYHEDAENIQVAVGEPLRGREALLESFITRILRESGSSVSSDQRGTTTRLIN